MAANYISGPMQVTAGNGRSAILAATIPRSPAPARFMPITVPAGVRRLPCAACAWTTCPCCWPWSPTRGHATAPASKHRPRRAAAAGLAARGAGKLGHWAVVADGDAVGWASLTPRHRPHPARLPAATARLGPGCATQPPPAVRLCLAHAGCPPPPSPGRTTGLAARARKTRLRPGRHKRTTGATPWPICCRVRPRPDPRHHAYPFLEPSTHDRRPQHRPADPRVYIAQTWKA